MYWSTSTSTEDFPEMYLSTLQVLYKLYLSTDVLKYKVLLPGSGSNPLQMHEWYRFELVIKKDRLPGRTYQQSLGKEEIYWYCSHLPQLKCIQI